MTLRLPPRLPRCTNAQLATGLPGSSWWPSSRPAYQLVPQRATINDKGKRKVQRVGESVWGQIGLIPIRDTPNRAPHNYGLCEMRAFQSGIKRPVYDFIPRDCRLLPLDNSSSTCAAFGKKRVLILIVGDSTAAQVFLAFVVLLNARLGRNGNPTATMTRLTASACNDKVRVSFVRNDLLLATRGSGQGQPCIRRSSRTRARRIRRLCAAQGRRR